MNFWKDGLSIDETKTSTLIILLIICILFALTFYVIVGDVTPNLVNIITALIYSVAGVNVAQSLAKVTQKTDVPPNQNQSSNNAIPNALNSLIKKE